jgi:hypothetical protein
MKQLLLLMTICCVTLLANPIISNAQEWPAGVIGGLQHAGAVHFYMQPGTLNVTLYKRNSAGTGSADRTMKAFFVRAGRHGFKQTDFAFCTIGGREISAIATGTIAGKNQPRGNLYIARDNESGSICAPGELGIFD